MSDISVTFTHEGNKTYTDSLVNFEKMHMLAQTIRTMRMCRSRPLSKPQLSLKKKYTFYVAEFSAEFSEITLRLTTVCLLFRYSATHTKKRSRNPNLYSMS